MNIWYGLPICHVCQHQRQESPSEGTCANCGAELGWCCYLAEQAIGCSQPGCKRVLCKSCWHGPCSVAGEGYCPGHLATARERVREEAVYAGGGVDAEIPLAGAEHARHSCEQGLGAVWEMAGTLSLMLPDNKCPSRSERDRQLLFSLSDSMESDFERAQR